MTHGFQEQYLGTMRRLYFPGKQAGNLSFRMELWKLRVSKFRVVG